MPSSQIKEDLERPIAIPEAKPETVTFSVSGSGTSDCGESWVLAGLSDMANAYKATDFEFDDAVHVPDQRSESVHTSATSGSDLEPPKSTGSTPASVANAAAVANPA